MAFTDFISGTTSDANEVNANFYYIANGDLLPIVDTAGMDYTTGTYDLGSSAYKWDNIFIESIDNYCYKLIASEDLSYGEIMYVSGLDNYTDIQITGNIELNSIILNGASSPSVYYVNHMGNVYYGITYSVNLVLHSSETTTSDRLQCNNGAFVLGYGDGSGIAVSSAYSTPASYIFFGMSLFYAGSSITSLRIQTNVDSTTVMVYAR